MNVARKLGGLMAHGVKEGQLAGGLPYLSFGDGPPLVMFPGLGLSNTLPRCWRDGW